ncbi:MAG TPA: choice-of-anchor tandem repeat GloVer-containing protein [Terriglobales bacterium]
MELRIFRVKTASTLLTASLIVVGLRAQDQAPGQPASSGPVLKTLFEFDNTNGAYPQAALAQGADGNFYGTTVGGTDGTVFNITPEGQLATLHSFNGTDGNDPIAALVLGTDGNFYGTTYGGGSTRTLARLHAVWFSRSRRRAR